MFGDPLEKGPPLVVGQQLRDVCEQRGVVEVGERAVGDHARTMGVQPTQRDGGVGRCSWRPDERPGFESAQVLLKEPMCGTVFPIQKPDDQSVAGRGPRGHRV
jgi:hypothetical protein